MEILKVTENNWIIKWSNEIKAQILKLSKNSFKVTLYWDIPPSFTWEGILSSREVKKLIRQKLK